MPEGGSEESIIERTTRELIRAKFEDPDAPVEDCRVDGCETDLVGLTAEDYAVHLVHEHPFFQSPHAIKDILSTTARAVNRTDVDRYSDTGVEHSEGGER